jgi:hypothetical protein
LKDKEELGYRYNKKNKLKIMENQTPGTNNYSLNGTTSNGTNANNTITLGQNYYSYPNGYTYYYVPQYPFGYYPSYPTYPSYPYQPMVPIQNNPPVIINTPLNTHTITRSALNKQPQVHITAGKSRTKLFGSNVYMPDNTDFEIELFNPSNETLGVKFKMNGKYISESMLVLYPGKHMFLDRYLNENKKFKYITYTVDDNAESKEAIAENGNIQVEFYREVWLTGITNSAMKTTTVQNSNILNGSCTTNLANIPSTNTFYCSSLNNVNQNIGSTLTTATSYGLADNNSLDVNFNQDWLSNEVTKEFKELETGMIAKGEKSDTEFNDVDINFEALSVAKFNFKILPLSQKPIEPKDLVVYCSNLKCKRKAKKDDKFCSGCGTKL